jgi:hypothetical protein
MPFTIGEGPPFTGLCMACVRRWALYCLAGWPYQQGDSHRRTLPMVTSCNGRIGTVKRVLSLGDGKGWILRRRMGPLLFY